MAKMLQLRRLAQAGWVIRGSGTTLVIDAFLSPRADRLVPPTILPSEVHPENYMADEPAL